MPRVISAARSARLPCLPTRLADDGLAYHDRNRPMTGACWRHARLHYRAPTRRCDIDIVDDQQRTRQPFDRRMDYRGQSRSERDQPGQGRALPRLRSLERRQQVGLRATRAIGRIMCPPAALPSRMCPRATVRSRAPPVHDYSVGIFPTHPLQVIPTRRAPFHSALNEKVCDCLVSRC